MNAPLSQAEQTKVELIGKDISYIQKDIAEIKSSVKELAGVYITKLQYDDGLKTFDSRLSVMEKSNGLWKIMSPAISSVITAAVTFLLINYIQNAK